MAEMEVKVTWSLAWGLFWRGFLIYIGLSLAIWLIIVIVALALGTAFMPW